MLFWKFNAVGPATAVAGFFPCACARKYVGEGLADMFSSLRFA